MKQFSVPKLLSAHFCSSIAKNGILASQRRNNYQTIFLSSFQRGLSSTPGGSLCQKDLSPTQQLFASVVKVFCDHTDPNFSQPWQMRRQGSSTGSGFAIDGRRLMTNAHCISYQNRILVRKPGDARRYPAKVEAVAHECDLAVLTVDDEEFWQNLPSLKFGDLPNLHDPVVVVGYPTGGDNLSITAGVVSRLDVTTYAHSNFKLLCAQIDAAINPGNSGGPAFRISDGVVAGVAFQGYGEAQNIGYMVPTNIISHFLKDIEKHSVYTGFVSLGITYQSLENSDLRTYFGLTEDLKPQLPAHITPTGILIAQVDDIRMRQFAEDAKKKFNNPEDIICGLQRNDILLALNNTDIANDGTIHFRGMERVHLSHATSDFFPGDSVDALILRDFKILNVKVGLYPPNYLVPEHQWDKIPRYFIYGGLVFCPLTIDYLKDEFGKKYYERAPTTLMEALTDFFPKKLDQEIVILSQILVSDITIGYDVKNSRLHKVDGIPINSLKHLIDVLGQNRNAKFAEFEFDHSVRIILDRESIRQNSNSILSRHSISKAWSDDLNECLQDQKLIV